MFTEIQGSRKEIGDVDVLYHQGLYHLFHLVLPNHDFIAHAVSTDGINWRRVNNALFIGDPGSWDDLMLWTMHVSPDPHHAGRWRMFYTGLSRRERGRLQRIGLAVSNDLYHWRKMSVNWQDTRGSRDPDAVKVARRLSAQQEAGRVQAEFNDRSCFPLEADSRYYESNLSEGRHLVSFRDPCYYHENGEGWLLASARVKDGPVVRRGCVSLLKETRPYHFEALGPLHHPGLYDDIEVPNLIRLGDAYYLIGSIREDAKIRYWHADMLGEPWRNYYDNVLMAKGNYAARVCHDEKGWLLWNFFTPDINDRTTNNIMPPPKRFARTEEGLLRLTSYERFDEWVRDEVDVQCLHFLKEGLKQQHCSIDGSRLDLESEAGFQAFVFDESINCFRFRASLALKGKGKCGLVFRIDPETHDGYYLSFDLFKGVAQLRSWNTGPDGMGEQMMKFNTLQTGYWYSKTPGRARVQLLGFGSYLELSIDDYVVLSLADQTFQEGLLGVYLETANLELSHVQLQRMYSPYQTDQHLVTG